MKRLQHLIPDSALEEDALYSLEAASAVNDTYFAYEFPGIEKVLSKPETQIIQMLYLSGFSVGEAALRLGRSRQAVNQMKNRALKKLKMKLLDKP